MAADVEAGEGARGPSEELAWSSAEYYKVAGDSSTLIACFVQAEIECISPLFERHFMRDEIVEPNGALLENRLQSVQSSGVPATIVFIPSATRSFMTDTSSGCAAFRAVSLWLTEKTFLN